MEKEDILLQKRVTELAKRSFSQNIFTFTGFLSLSEQDLVYRLETELRYAGMTVFGGSESCDRKMVRFGSPEELGYEEAFPIACIAMEPLIEKFGENLSHRDYLGALMNLGIERETLGDIFIKGKIGYLFCLDRMADYIVEQLEQVRHTHIRCRRVEGADYIQKEIEEQILQAASERIDAVIAKLYHVSRTQSLEYFRGKKVYVNGRLCENNSYLLKENEEVSVRGYGKFLYQGVQSQTKKGKSVIKVGIYK